MVVQVIRSATVPFTALLVALLVWGAVFMTGPAILSGLDAALSRGIGGYEIKSVLEKRKNPQSPPRLSLILLKPTLRLVATRFFASSFCLLLRAVKVLHPLKLRYPVLVARSQDFVNIRWNVVFKYPCPPVLFLSNFGKVGY